MSFIRSGRRVYPVIRVLPDDGIFGLLMKVDIIQEHPKSEKFPNVGYGYNRDLVDLEYPSVPLEGLTDLPTLSFRGLEDERCNILRFVTKEPRGIPKRRFGTISHHDSRRSIEKLEVLDGAGVSQAKP